MHDDDPQPSIPPLQFLRELCVLILVGAVMSYGFLELLRWMGPL